VIFPKYYAMTATVVLLIAALLCPFTADAASCESVARQVSKKALSPIDETELAEILNTLNASDNRNLPPKFLTKKQAREAGWKPGKDLWSIRKLRGKSMGGDSFGNFEKKLPKGQWREADLNYKGGHRGPKRLVYSRAGVRFVTVDHYKTFLEVPACK
jgi:hypothetical protein